MITKKTPRPGWIVPAALGASIALVLAWQHRTTQQLRIELAPAREANRELSDLRAKRARLVDDALSPEQLEQLRGDHAALLRLRAEIDQLGRRAAVAPPNTAAAASALAGRDAVESMIRVDQMTNAGRATPRAASETFVWALQRGDIDTAASLLVFTPEARTAMEQVLTKIPPHLHADYGTPERLMAFVMAGNTGTTGIRYLQATESASDMVVQFLEVERKGGGIAKDKVLLRHEADGWRRLITPAAVTMLANYLAASPDKFHVETKRE